MGGDSIIIEEEFFDHICSHLMFFLKQNDKYDMALSK
jgi:hypothetical protein